jgi:hypothetical protein
MSRLGKTWCDHCKKDTHDTEKCWGQGTMAYEPNPLFNAPPPFFEQAMTAIRMRDSAPTFDQPFCRIES